MKLMKTLVASAAAATMLVGLAVTPAAATTPNQISDEDLNTVQGSSPYVEAETEEEAMKKLDKIEKDNPGGISTQAAVKDYGPCELYPESFHVRGSSGDTAGGVKPVTVCTEGVTGIAMASQLQVKKGLYWKEAGPQVKQTAGADDLKVGKYKYKKKNDWAVKFQQKNVNYECKGTKKHDWSADIIGRVRFEGRTYWARVSATPASEKCGPN